MFLYRPNPFGWSVQYFSLTSTLSSFEISLQELIFSVNRFLLSRYAIEHTIPPTFYPIFSIIVYIPQHVINNKTCYPFLRALLLFVFDVIWLFTFDMKLTSWHNSVVVFMFNLFTVLLYSLADLNIFFLLPECGSFVTGLSGRGVELICSLFVSVTSTVLLNTTSKKLS